MRRSFFVISLPMIKSIGESFKTITVVVVKCSKEEAISLRKLKLIFRH
jgi:hypothetical protein